MLDVRESFVKADIWQSYGGLETLISYGANHRPDWASLIPESHWEFFEHTRRFLETGHCIYVHACLDAELDMRDQPDWLLFWEFFDRLQPHKSGKQIICGHTPQRSGEIKYTDYALCLDTAPASGGWLTCLDVDSGDFWQANEHGDTREGRLDPRC